jgi:predicted site-specific integrase-resolvase
MKEKLINEARASKSLGISYLTLRLYRQAGKIKPLPVSGTAVIYSASALSAFRKEYLPKIKSNRRKIGWGITRQCRTVKHSETQGGK